MARRAMVGTGMVVAMVGTGMVVGPWWVHSPRGKSATRALTRMRALRRRGLS